MDRGGCSQRGAGTIEHVALVALIALAALGAIVAVRALGEVESGRELGSAIARKTRCAVHHPDPCWQDPLTEAYGRSIGGAVRALAPAPATRTGAGGLPLVGVDFRRCRQARCAVPLPGAAGERLTESNRRTTAFVTVRDQRRQSGIVAIDYWIYRPTIGWELVAREADRGTIAEHAMTPLLESANPKLVPLETMWGRDHYRFRAGEQPPWRGQVESRY